MEKIAFISGDTFIYWSPILLALGAVTAICYTCALYVAREGRLLAPAVTALLSAVLGIPLARLIHWYCRSASYAGFTAAMTDYSQGGYALAGLFLGCFLAACVARLLRLTKSLPRLLDCMAIGGSAGLAVGRLASLFNASDRGMTVPDSWGLPFASKVANAVSGAMENRLATFALQSILAASLAVGLTVYLAVCFARKKKAPDGDVCLIFLLCYGSFQAICDSTRYDSLFLRSNGFVSIVQILGLCAIVLVLAVFSVRMVKSRGLRPWQYPLWGAIAGLLGLAGYMEYYVQRHGNEAVLAYSVMGGCLAAVTVLGLTVRLLGRKAQGKETEV